MYRKDIFRLKAKIYHKLRWLYITRFQTAQKHLNCYQAYRRYKGFCGKINIKDNVSLYMTKIVNPSAGIGDQLASWITGYYYAKLFGVEYAYSPLYPGKWNGFLGFGEEEITSGELLKRGYKKVWVPHFDENNPADIQMIRDIIKSREGRKTVFYLEIDQVYTDQIGVMEDIRKKFNHAASRQGDKLIYKPNRINIALHVRRGDIVEGQMTEDSSLTFRWMTNDYYIRVLDKVLSMCGDNKVSIYFFSQGSEEDFPEFSKYEGLHWCLDMTAQASFLHMVRADILITGKSSFSYKPALLSDGIRICPKNFWHAYPQDEDWILVDDNGCFNYDKLQQALSRRKSLQHWNNKI